MAITIRTNNQWRNFAYRSEVPEDVLSSQFSHLAEDDALDGFFCYHGFWYHTSDFMAGCPVKGWDGYSSDSFYSGVLIKIAPDGEQYKVATYMA